MRTKGLKGYKHLQCHICEQAFYAPRNAEVTCPCCGEQTPATTGYLVSHKTMWNRITGALSYLRTISIRTRTKWRRPRAT